MSLLRRIRVPLAFSPAFSLTRSLSAVPKSSIFAPLDTFTRRHIGIDGAQETKMLDLLQFKSMDEFISSAVPPEIRIGVDVVSDSAPVGAIPALSESELLRRATELGAKNLVYQSFIGLGYHQAVSLSIDC